jgi:hypothetical protein
MVHKRVKKALGKVKKRITGRSKGDRLPSLGEISDVFQPRLLVAPGIGPVLIRNPAIAAGLAAYAMAERTEGWWGPPVEATGEATAKQWEDYQDWYERNVRSRYAGSEIDPNSPLAFQAPQMVEGGPVQRVKRKVSKANKATKRAYRFLADKVKGKMTQKRCCELLKKAAKMAGKANPNTPSRIGKGRSPMKTECRKIRKSIWNTKRRY